MSINMLVCKNYIVLRKMALILEVKIKFFW